MSDNARKELIEQANALALEFPSNIPTAKLQAMVDESIDALPSGEPEKIEEKAPASPEVAVDVPERKPRGNPKEIAKRLKIKKAKDLALATEIVTITNKDNRENDVMTTAYLSFENQYFGRSRLVPLDIPVELERALIHIAESTTMTLHKDDGTGTGNKVPVTVKKFAISYSRQQPGE